jgi:hypothetical protein
MFHKKKKKGKYIASKDEDDCKIYTFPPVDDDDRNIINKNKNDSTLLSLRYKEEMCIFCSHLHLY